MADRFAKFFEGSSASLDAYFVCHPNTSTNMVEIDPQLEEHKLHFTSSLNPLNPMMPVHEPEFDSNEQRAIGALPDDG